MFFGIKKTKCQVTGKQQPCTFARVDVTMFSTVLQFIHFLVRSSWTCFWVWPIFPWCRCTIRHSFSCHWAGAGVTTLLFGQATWSSSDPHTHIVTRDPCPGCPGCMPRTFSNSVYLAGILDAWPRRGLRTYKESNSPIISSHPNYGPTASQLSPQQQWETRLSFLCFSCSPLNAVHWVQPLSKEGNSVFLIFILARKKVGTTWIFHPTFFPILLHSPCSLLTEK